MVLKSNNEVKTRINCHKLKIVLKDINCRNKQKNLRITLKNLYF